jgi:hypothetical protein
MGKFHVSIFLTCHFNENDGMVFPIITTTHVHWSITHDAHPITHDTHLITCNEWNRILIQICLC